MLAQVLVLSVASFAVAAEQPTDATKKEMEALAGFWKGQSLIQNGKPAPKEAAEKLRLKIVGDKFNGMTFTVDPTAKPKALDLTFEQNGKTVVAKCIYQLTGDTLRICRPFKDPDQRPTKFESIEGVALIVWKRAAAPWTIPVLVVNYFPLTPDKTKIDIAVTSNVGAPVKEIEAKCARQTLEVIQALQQGSRFRPYKNPKALPSLQYKVVGNITYYEPVPHHAKKKQYTDYNKIMERIKIRDWVETKGVREVWIWGYHSKEIAPVESNMASVHGNVSNSHRDPFDLPVLKHTYTVYHYNYERGTDMAVHNHLHQIEAVMRHHGGELWQRFEGKPGGWRCGNCHFPINGVKDYDYANKTYVESDIEDWRPEGFGKKQKLNCARWNCVDLNWYVYWMQAIPGANNGLTFQSRKLGNWWEFFGNYDHAATRPNRLTD